MRADLQAFINLTHTNIQPLLYQLSHFPEQRAITADRSCKLLRHFKPKQTLVQLKFIT